MEQYEKSLIQILLNNIPVHSGQLLHDTDDSHSLERKGVHGELWEGLYCADDGLQGGHEAIVEKECKSSTFSWLAQTFHFL